jgi:hypothetical protein
MQRLTPQLLRVQVILAADVLYDEDVTEAFCAFLSTLLAAKACDPPGAGSAADAAAEAPASAPPWPPPPQRDVPTTEHRTHGAGAPAPREAQQAQRTAPLVLLAAEKRFNFTLRDMDARAEAFEAFERAAPRAALRWRRLPVAEVPRVLVYSRGSDLELLHVWLDTEAQAGVSGSPKDRS